MCNRAKLIKCWGIRPTCFVLTISSLDNRGTKTNNSNKVVGNHNHQGDSSSMGFLKVNQRKQANLNPAAELIKVGNPPFDEPV